MRNKIQQRASLHERAVQKVASDNVTFKKPRAKASRKRKPNSKVRVAHWSDGLDPRIVKAVEDMHIPRVHERIKVVSSTEVIIINNPEAS